MSASAIAAIAADPPDLTDAEVLDVLDSAYGLRGDLTPLVSERDQNFRLDAAEGQRYVVKIANLSEPEEITDFQIRALLHLEQSGCPVPVPRVVRTASGQVSESAYAGDACYLLRVVTYLPGQPLEAVTPDTELAYDLGRSLADLDSALQSFSHPGESQVLLWDMQRASEVRGIIGHVPEPGMRDRLHECLDAFEKRVLPVFPSLRSQVIHNDLNPGNVLVSDTKPMGVAGVIDFGDMLRAPLVIDLAIAASYMRRGDHALDVIKELVRGFESVIALEQSERALFYDLVRTRLATTVSILHWRADARSADDPYLKKALAERSAERFFDRVTALGRRTFDRHIFDD